MGIAIAFTHLPHITGSHESEATEIIAKSMRRSIWSYRHTVLAALGIFLYVGMEVGLATQMVLYFSDSQHGGLTALSASAAQKLVTYYWVGALIGRLLGSWVLTRIKAGKLLGAFGLIAAALVVVSIMSTGPVAIWSLILAGFFNSIMFPNIFALGIAGLGTMTSKGSGLDHDRGLGRRSHPGLHRLDFRSLQLRAFAAGSRGLLPLYRVLRLCGTQTVSDGQRVSIDLFAFGRQSVQARADCIGAGWIEQYN